MVLGPTLLIIRQELSEGLVCVHVLSHFIYISLWATLRTVTCQASLPWDSPDKNTGVGLSCPPPGDLPNPGIEAASHISCIGRQVLYQ